MKSCNCLLGLATQSIGSSILDSIIRTTIALLTIGLFFSSNTMRFTLKHQGVRLSGPRKDHATVSIRL